MTIPNASLTRPLKLITCAIVSAMLSAASVAAEPAIDTSRGDAMFAAYFADQTRQLAESCLTEISSREDWNARRGGYRKQLFEMLGLDPIPERAPLQARTTGKLEHDEFTVEKVVFQSRPHLYVTANLYLPKGANRPLPTILYVCGHGNVKKDGISYGSKTNYQHHAIWFARHGYVC
ncbi:MAG TPA: acetylxylan esterase, partial [Pirellulales bacterium]|nr:acetylxylan esterase [Pirellulales bacterium]